MNLSERLKALGVRRGMPENPPAPPRRGDCVPIEQAVPGEVRPTPYGETFVRRQAHPATERYGRVPLAFRTPPDLLAAWMGAPSLREHAPEDYLFFDTETTGLGGGGTYAFLIGAGRFRGETFEVAQFFLREPGEEAAQLTALSEFAAGCGVWVSFNGRAFDGPLIKGRCTLNGVGNPLEGGLHLDLLHLARRLWRERLPSRTLLSLESQILGVTRTQEDVPGWVIPQLYLDYLRTGDARLLKSVFYHNHKDVLAMAALLNHLGDLLAAPLARPETPALDLAGIGGVYEKVGRPQEAAAVYREALALGLPEETRRRIRRKLSFLLKRAEAWEAALAWWQEAASEGECYACEELAKYYEHRARRLEEALHWTQAALEGLATAPPAQRLQWEPAFRRRLARLERRRRER